MQIIIMKKIATLLTAGLFSVLSVSAFACPKGTQLQGGTGANHKGGKCVAAHVVKAKKETTATQKIMKHDSMQAATTSKKVVTSPTHTAKPEIAKAAKTS